MATYNMYHKAVFPLSDLWLVMTMSLFVHTGIETSKLNAFPAVLSEAHAYWDAITSRIASEPRNCPTQCPLNIHIFVTNMLAKHATRNFQKPLLMIH